jgi:hypothetical protein
MAAAAAEAGQGPGTEPEPEPGAEAGELAVGELVAGDEHTWRSFWRCGPRPVAILVHVLRAPSTGGGHRSIPTGYKGDLLAGPALLGHYYLL